MTIDGRSGNIIQFTDRRTGHDFVDKTINGGLNAFRWLPANVDSPVADSNTVVTVVEPGPLVAEINVRSQGKGCRSVSRSIRLVAGQPWLEISNVVDKLPLIEKDGIHFGFGFNIPEGVTRVDIPWGIMEIEKDQWPQGNRNWLTLQRWLDISNGKSGITWCSLDAPLFEYGKMTANLSQGWGGKGPWISKLEPSSTVYSWVMNNHWHTNFPLTQNGPVNFRYRIMPHGGYDATTANRFGLEQAQPLAHVTAGINPKIKPMVAIDNPRVCITILKSTGGDKTVILRLRSLSDQIEKVRISFPAGNPTSLNVCEMEEIPGKPVDETVEILPYGMATQKFRF